MTSSSRLGLVNYHAWCLQVNVTDLLRTLGDFEFVNRYPPWKQSKYLREWEHIYIHGDGVTRPWPESYCTLLYGNSLIKAGSHTVELFSDFARNLCRYCTSDVMCVTFRLLWLPPDKSQESRTIFSRESSKAHYSSHSEDNNAPLSLLVHWCHADDTDSPPDTLPHQHQLLTIISLITRLQQCYLHILTLLFNAISAGYLCLCKHRIFSRWQTVQPFYNIKKSLVSIFMTLQDSHCHKPYNLTI